MNQELLQEAEKRYPRGTVIKPIVTNIDTGEFKDAPWEVVKGSYYWAEGSDCPACYTDDGPAALFLNGKWAEIKNEITNYEIY